MAKIALLFLTISSLNHEQYWIDFLRGHESKYSLYVHSKEPMQATSPFKKYELSTRIPTTWANTMKAQIVLLKEALKDPKNERFIFLSESTIPFCSFDTMYNFVLSTPKSIFPYVSNEVHYDPNRTGTFWNHHHYQPHRDLQPIEHKFQYKAPQWVVLNRKHAELMAQDNDIIHVVTCYPCDNEHYPATFLAVKGLLGEVKSYQTTYDDWVISSNPSSPFTYTNMRNHEQYERAVKAIQGVLYNKHKYLFGRKFARGCDLSPLDRHLPYRMRK